jgi:signal transduction histidine kinase
MAALARITGDLSLRSLSAGDLAVGLGLAAIATVEVAAGKVDAPFPVALLAALVATVPLVWRRRAPLAVSTTTIGVLALLAGTSALSGNPPVFGLLGFLVASYSPPAYCDLREAIAGGVVALAGMTVLVFLGDDQTKLSDAAFGYTEVVIAWALGRTVHQRQARADRLEHVAHELEAGREEEARRLVAGERGRIARELHDVVAHGVSVMVVQAQAGRRVMKRDAAQAEESFLRIETAGRQALVELERMLGVMRADDPHDSGRSPQPGLAYLDELVQRARAAGVQVHVQVIGEAPSVSRGLDLAAYRIVQEALTNVVKHGGGGPTEVRVSYRPHELELRIANEIRAGATGTGRRNGGGHGLVGMRERVALYEGDLEAGPTPDGGYVVRATLPLRERS